MSIGTQILYYRKKRGWSQKTLSEELAKEPYGIDVSAQAISSWEHDEYPPETKKLTALAKVLDTTVGRLLEENKLPQSERRIRMYSEERMYNFVRKAAVSHELPQTLEVLPFMRERHAGQPRKGEQKDVLYINHPLTMACGALSIGLYDDDILSAILLHDVVEDCGVLPEELPANGRVKEIVRLVTKDKHPIDAVASKKRYYEEIAADPQAAFVKCLDRLNNLSNMALGFTRDRMAEYVDETEEYIVPLIRVIKYYDPRYNNAAWLIGYHMYSLLETYKRLL